MKNQIIKTNTLPFRSLFNGLLNDDLFNSFDFGSTVPSTNVIENGDVFSIELAVPGYKKDSFNISIKDNYLKISSSDTNTNEEKNDKYHKREFYYSSFERSFYLPNNVDGDKIEAKYEDGILNVTIPKKVEVSNAKLIEVK